MKIICRREACPNFCREPIRFVAEYETSVLYVCPVCYSKRVIGKDRVGGTIGQKSSHKYRKYTMGFRGMPEGVVR